MSDSAIPWTVDHQAPLSMGLPGKNGLLFPTPGDLGVGNGRRSSWPRDQTHISWSSCIGRQILYHWAPGKPTIPVQVVIVWRCEVKWKSLSCVWLLHGLHSPWNSPGQNTGLDSHSLLQGSSQPRDRTQVSLIAGEFFTSWATRETQEYWSGWCEDKEAN